MKEYKIFCFEEVKDYIWLNGEAWNRVKAAPKEDYIQVMPVMTTAPARKTGKIMPICAM